MTDKITKSREDKIIYLLLIIYDYTFKKHEAILRAISDLEHLINENELMFGIDFCEIYELLNPYSLLASGETERDEYFYSNESDRIEHLHKLAKIRQLMIRLALYGYNFSEFYMLPNHSAQLKNYLDNIEINNKKLLKVLKLRKIRNKIRQLYAKDNESSDYIHRIIDDIYNALKIGGNIDQSVKDLIAESGEKFKSIAGSLLMLKGENPHELIAFLMYIGVIKYAESNTLVYNMIGTTDKVKGKKYGEAIKSLPKFVKIKDRYTDSPHYRDGYVLADIDNINEISGSRVRFCLLTHSAKMFRVMNNIKGNVIGMDKIWEYNKCINYKDGNKYIFNELLDLYSCGVSTDGIEKSILYKDTYLRNLEYTMAHFLFTKKENMIRRNVTEYDIEIGTHDLGSCTVSVIEREGIKEVIIPNLISIYRISEIHNMFTTEYGIDIGSKESLINDAKASWKAVKRKLIDHDSTIRGAYKDILNIIDKAKSDLGEMNHAEFDELYDDLYEVRKNLEKELSDFENLKLTIDKENLIQSDKLVTMAEQIYNRSVLGHIDWLIKGSERVEKEFRNAVDNAYDNYKAATKLFRLYNGYVNFKNYKIKARYDHDRMIIYMPVGEMLLGFKNEGITNSARERCVDNYNQIVTYKDFRDFMINAKSMKREVGVGLMIEMILYMQSGDYAESIKLGKQNINDINVYSRQEIRLIRAIGELLYYKTESSDWDKSRKTKYVNNILKYIGKLKEEMYNVRVEYVENNVEIEYLYLREQGMIICEIEEEVGRIIHNLLSLKDRTEEETVIREINKSIVKIMCRYKDSRSGTLGKLKSIVAEYQSKEKEDIKIGERVIMLMGVKWLEINGVKTNFEESELNKEIEKGKIRGKTDKIIMSEVNEVEYILKSYVGWQPRCKG